MDKHRVNARMLSRVAEFLLRVVSGLMFVQAGGLILFGWFGGMPGNARLVLMSQTGVGGIIEFFGGLALLLGLLTPPAAFLLSGTMAVAYWQFHFPKARWPLQNEGMPAVLLCFICLFFAAWGGGEWSLDALLRRRSVNTETTPGSTQIS
jgi:putative oxidoreductase